jgi:hypothetical protein
LSNRYSGIQETRSGQCLALATHKGELILKNLGGNLSKSREATSGAELLQPLASASGSQEDSETGECTDRRYARQPEDAAGMLGRRLDTNSSLKADYLRHAQTLITPYSEGTRSTTPKTTVGWGESYGSRGRDGRTLRAPKQLRRRRHIPAQPSVCTLPALIVTTCIRTRDISTRQILDSAPHVGLKAESVAFSFGGVQPTQNGATV